MWESPERVKHISKILTNDNYKNIICEQVDFSAYTKEELELIKYRLIDTLESTNVRGLGLAAPQIGIYLRVIAVINETGSSFDVYFNPKIRWHSNKTMNSVEYCLSFPGKEFRLKRFKHVSIEFQDVYGETFIIDPNKKHSRIFQHEIDHLNGKRV